MPKLEVEEGEVAPMLSDELPEELADGLGVVENAELRPEELSIDDGAELVLERMLAHDVVEEAPVVLVTRDCPRLLLKVFAAGVIELLVSDVEDVT